MGKKSENLSSKKEYIDFAAEQFARLFYQHYLYLKRQKKKEKQHGNVAEQFSNQKPSV
jgi:hypothetical protein